MSQDLIHGQLGNYRIERLLGRGGFAEVYLGEHIFLKTPAAIKLLHTRKQNVHDFLQEARLLASLQHPHIVAIREFDLYNGMPFLVMEYIPYGTLRQRHPKGSRLPAERVVVYVQQMASALSYLHTRRLAHGDVKPENMLIGEQDKLYLSDFGIAILANRQQEQALVGTVDYMSPEQLHHQLIPASDQYALGIIAYEWLCGAPPFIGNYAEIATQHVLTPPSSLRERIANLPAEIDAVILRALAKEPTQRFPTVSDFAIALENAYLGTATTMRRAPLPAPLLVPDALLTQPEQPTGSPTRPTLSRRSLLIASATGVAALGLAGTGGFFWWKRTQQGARTSISSPSHNNPPQTQPQMSRQGTIRYIYTKQTASITSLAWSPDGKRIASASSELSSTSEHQVHVWDALTGNNPVIYRGHTAAINVVAWSPDGKYIASGGQGSPLLHVWEAATGKRVVTFAKEHDPLTQLYWLSANQLLFANFSTGRVTRWKPFEPANWQRIYDGDALANKTSCVVSPDGNYVVTQFELTPFYEAVYRIADKRQLSMLNKDEMTGSASPLPYYWSSNSQRIVSTFQKYVPEVWDPLTGRKIATFKSDYAVVALGWSSDSQYLASSGNAGVVFIWNATNGSELYRYAPHAQNISSLAWSPNGQLIASGGDQGTTEVWQAI